MNHRVQLASRAFQEVTWSLLHDNVVVVVQLIRSTFRPPNVDRWSSICHQKNNQVIQCEIIHLRHHHHLGFFLFNRICLGRRRSNQSHTWSTTQCGWQFGICLWVWLELYFQYDLTCKPIFLLSDMVVLIFWMVN